MGSITAVLNVRDPLTANMLGAIGPDETRGERPEVKKEITKGIHHFIMIATGPRSPTWYWQIDHQLVQELRLG